MQHNDNLSEEVFARLCSNKYFGGFVYQNPKFTLDTEREAGDVVLWVRDSSTGNTRGTTTNSSMIKRPRESSSSTLAVQLENFTMTRFGSRQRRLYRSRL